MWTYEDFEGVIENCTVRKQYKDRVHSMTQLIAHEGYVMHYKTDLGYTDEETGEYYPPSYSYQVYCPADFDVTEYEAVLITPGMEVYDKPTDTEVM